MSKLLAFLCTILFAGATFAPAQERSLIAEEQSIEVGGEKRTFRFYVPPDLPESKWVPLVFVFHGGGGHGAGMERLTKFNQLAAKEKFLVVYPDGVDKHWNDGREMGDFKTFKKKIDDVAFVAALIDKISKDHKVDPKRVFATGMSNGGIFSHYLGARLSTRIAAIAPVVGGIAEPYEKEFKPEKPVSVFVIQGVDDPLVPFDGGLIKPKQGRVLSTDKTVEMWVEKNGCRKEPKTGDLPDNDPKDGCRVKWSRWSEGKDGAEVLLYKVEGMGHTWPSGPQYLPEALIGKVCRDFDATEAIWEFFKAHPKP